MEKGTISKRAPEWFGGLWGLSYIKKPKGMRPMFLEKETKRWSHWGTHNSEGNRKNGWYKIIWVCVKYKKQGAQIKAMHYMEGVPWRNLVRISLHREQIIDGILKSTLCYTRWPMGTPSSIAYVPCNQIFVWKSALKHVIVLKSTRRACKGN